MRPPVANGGDRLPQLILHALHQTVQHGGVAVDGARLHTVNGVVSDQMRRIDQIDVGQLRGPGGQRVYRQPQTGNDHAADIAAGGSMTDIVVAVPMSKITRGACTEPGRLRRWRPGRRPAVRGCPS